jgi:hypothetical protein
MSSLTAITLLGDTSGLQDELRKAGIVAGDMSAKIRGSAADAGAALADLAKESGGSADEQADAAGRGAAAWSEMAASITRAQRAAGDAAAKAAKAVGASVDEQRAAYTRAIATQSEFEEAQSRAAAAAKMAGEQIAGSAELAGRAAAGMAAAMGASADEQADAAGRAAAAFSDQAASMSRAQRVAGAAASDAAASVGASLDAQKAAYERAVAAQAGYEDAQKRAADAAKVAGAEEADAAKRSAAAQIAAAKEASAAIEAEAARSEEARSKFAAFGGKAALGLTVGGGISGYESVKGAAALQSQMERLHTQAGVSQTSIAPLQKSVLGMAGQVGESPDQLAQGLYHVASQLNATLPPAHRMSTELDVLKVAAEGAKVGGADLTDVTNALGAAVVSGIKGVSNYREAMGAMNATVGAGDMKMQDLADSFGTGVVVQAKQAGLTIQQLGGALATLGDNNIRGAKAGTLMASTLRIMNAPSEAATEALNSVGLSATSLATTMHNGGLIPAIEELKQHLVESGATAEQQGLIITRAFGGRQSGGVRDLIDQIDRLKAKTADVGQGMNTFGADVLRNNQTAQQQFDELKAHVAALGDEFGMYLIPKLEAVAQATAGVVSWMKQHQAAAEALAAVIGGVLGAAIAVYAYTKAKAFVSATGDMLSAIGDFAKGAAGAASSIATKLGLISSSSASTSTEVAASSAETGASIETVGVAATTAEGTFTAAGDGIVVAADTTAEGVDTAIGSTGLGAILIAAGLAAAELATHWQTAMHAMEVAVNAMAKAAEWALNGLIDVLNKSIGLFNSTVGHLTGDIGKIGSVEQSNVFNTSGGENIAGQRRSANSWVKSFYKTPLGVTTNPNGSQGIQGSGNESKIENYLAAQGLSKVAIAGILGNLQQEHGFQTSNVPINAAGDGGMGIAQWTGSRLTAEEGYAKSQGLSATSLVAQLGYMMKELHGSKSSALSAVQNASTPAQAAHLWDQIYEGGSDPHGVRETDAQQIYATMGGKTAGATGGGGAHVSSKLAAAMRKYLSQGASGSSYSTAAATSTVPVAVATMLKTAEQLEGTPYLHGGGHGGWDPVAALKKIGLDCSGFVSQVLHAGGVSLPGPLTTTGLAQNLKRGAGKDVTVYDRANAGGNSHTFMEIMGKWFMEGGNKAVNPGQKVIQMTARQAAQEMSGKGFVAYHPEYSGKLATNTQLEKMGLSPTSLASGSLTSGNIQTLLAQALKTLSTLGKDGSRSHGNINLDASRMAGTVTAARTAGDTALLDQYGQDPGRITAQASALSAQLNRALKTQNLAAAQKAASDLVALSRSSGETLQHINTAWATYLTTLSTTGTTLLTKLQSNTQNGSVRGLESALGISTSNDAPQISSIIGRLGGNATTAQITGALDPTLNRNAITGTDYRTIVAQTSAARTASLGSIDRSHVSRAMKASEIAGLNARDQQTVQAANAARSGTSTASEGSFDKLIASLRSAHTTALRQLATQLVQAHHQALTTLAQELYAAQLTKDAASLNLEATQLKDQTQLASDVAAAQLTVVKAQAQKAQDATESQTTLVQAMTQTITDQWSAAAQAIQDQTQSTTDAANAAAQGISDQTQTQVDILGERGLFGLNLIAQKLTVAADEQKASDDQAIAVAQQNLDMVTTNAHTAIAQAQLQVDQVQFAQQQIAAAALQNADQVAIVQSQKIAGAQAHADTVQLGQDLSVALAQNAVDLSASAPKAVQDKVAAELAKAQATASVQEGAASAALSTVTSASDAAIAAAQNGATAASDGAAAAAAAASGTLAAVTGSATAAIAAAAGTLAAVTGAAAVAEAGATGAATVAGAAASTEFAGSGATINIYGLPLDNATAVASEAAWAARTQLGMAA